jgi:dTDP-4-dehydrorhamnose 3,5-epimerase
LKIIDTPLQDLHLVQSKNAGDARGIFSRLFCAESLRDILFDRQIVQINRSVTNARGTIRGMHFQKPPEAEMKLVRCIKGRVFDVAVDIRQDSPTFLHWHAIELSPESNLMFVIPEGFAHGFQTLSDDCDLLYLHTAPYNPDLEGGIPYDDPCVGISWPEPPVGISPRDNNLPRIDKSFSGIKL